MERLARQPCRTELMIFDLFYNQFTLLAQPSLPTLSAKYPRVSVRDFSFLAPFPTAKPGVYIGLANAYGVRRPPFDRGSTQGIALVAYEQVGNFCDLNPVKVRAQRAVSR